MPTPTESKLLTSAAPGPISLKGGRYVVGCTATFSAGNVSLQGLLPDGSTFAGVPNIAGTVAAFSAAGWQTFDLPPGQYKIVITTATNVNVSITSLPS